MARSAADEDRDGMMLRDGRALAGSLVVVTLVVTGPQGVRAQEPALGDWTASLGAGLVMGPAYPGSRSIQGTAIPQVDFAYRLGVPLLDTVFLNTRDGLGVVLLRAGPISFGGSLNYAFGRDEGDAARLRGLGDIDGAARAGLFLRANLGALGLSARVDRAVGDQEGTTLGLNATFAHPVSQDLLLIGQAGATWADGEYMRQWFGVDDQQAARSIFTAYRPEAGWQDVSASVTAAYALAPSWRLNGTLGVRHLLGDAGDSPITERATQPFGLVGVSYRF
jgi:outer membrane protein